MRWKEIKTTQHFSICKRACTQFACFWFLASPPVSRLRPFSSAYIFFLFIPHLSVYMCMCIYFFAIVFVILFELQLLSRVNARHNDDVGSLFCQPFLPASVFSIYNTQCDISFILLLWVCCCCWFFFLLSFAFLLQRRLFLAEAMAASGFSPDCNGNIAFMSNRIRKGSQ